jgi:hypothetical protein
MSKPDDWFDPMPEAEAPKPKRLRDALKPAAESTPPEDALPL